MLLLLLALLCQEGSLVIVGGGAVPAAARDRALELAGRNARVLVIPHASERLEAGDLFEGAKVLDLAKSPVEQIEKADLIWIGGGDQNRLMKALEGTGVPEAIRKRFREGAVVGGTSAGAAVMSKVMITGDADLEAIRLGGTKTAEGLSLWPEAIVDQHFVKRRRFNRLASAVLDHPMLVGVGIDEATAVIVSGGKFEVVGEGTVVVLDARKSKSPTALTFLKSGERFTLR